MHAAHTLLQVNQEPEERSFVEESAFGRPHFLQDSFEGDKVRMLMCQRLQRNVQDGALAGGSERRGVAPGSPCFGDVAIRSPCRQGPFSCPLVIGSTALPCLPPIVQGSPNQNNKKTLSGSFGETVTGGWGGRGLDPNGFEGSELRPEGFRFRAASAEPSGGNSTLRGADCGCICA